MGKIKEFFNKATDSYKSYMKQYVATNIIIIIATIFFTFLNYDDAYEIIMPFIRLSVIMAINFFTIETYNLNLKRKVPLYVLGILVAVGLERLITLNPSMEYARYFIGYSFILILVGLIKIIKNSELETSQYCTRVFKNLFNVGIVYLILAIGLTVILSIFISLLLTNGNYELIIRMHIALLGLYLVPAGLISLNNTKQETSKFIEKLILFVLLPLTILTTAIIYMYMAKIFLFKQIPSNSIFRIVTGLFICAFPVWTMAYTFKDTSKAVSRFCKIMPIAFAPFIGLQIYSLGARIVENGITPARYLGVMFIIFEVVAIFVSTYKDRKYLIHIFTSAIVIILISTIMPVINMQTFSNINQAQRLKSAWKSDEKYEDLSKEEKEKVQGAYYYLKEQKDSERYIPSYVSEESFEKNDKIDKDITLSNFIYFSTDENESVVNVEGYNRIKEITKNLYLSDVKELRNINLDNIYSIDMEDYTNKLVELNKNSKSDTKNYILNNRKIKINDDRDLYIKSLDLSYTLNEDGKLESIDYWKIKGYMLIK
jgi:hypothetical protein